MKKIFSWGMMLAAAFTLTNCAKEIENPAQQPESNGYPFEIVASTVDTKTVNDGMSTKWVDGDQINLFHAVGESTEYVSDGAFTVSDVAEGRFEGTLAGELDPQEEYDWYAFYPYTSQVVTPANTQAGYVTIGSKSGNAQSQNGNSNMDHIAGVNYPVAGRAIAVSAASTPSVTMSHVTSLVKVVVTNTTNDPLTVEEIILTAPELLVGTYYVDFSSDITSASFKSSGDSYTSNTAKLAVTNGEAISKGASAEFYLAVKPFTAAAGSTLQLYVNGAVKEIDLTKDVTFTAGKIKTLNYSYVATEVAGPEELTIGAFLSKEVNAAVWYQLTGTIKNIANTTYGNFDLVDETGSVYVYGLTKEKVASNDKSFASLGLKEGDVVTLIGTRAEYNTTAQVGGPAYYVSHIASVDAPVITCVDNVVTITASAGARIFYTTNGEEPTVNSPEYNAPFAIEETTEVKAIAAKQGMAVSAPTTKTCTYVQDNGGTEPQVIFLETFTGTNGVMGWSGNGVANGNSIKYDNSAWSVANAYGASDAIKLGSSSKKGSATTPVLDVIGNATLKFKAGAWSGDQTTLILKMTNGTLGQTSVTMKSGDWTEYEVAITGATAGAQITFEGKQASKARFFLDDVQIVQ